MSRLYVFLWGWYVGGVSLSAAEVLDKQGMIWDDTVYEVGCVVVAGPPAKGCEAPEWSSGTFNCFATGESSLLDIANALKNRYMVLVDLQKGVPVVIEEVEMPMAQLAKRYWKMIRWYPKGWRRPMALPQGLHARTIYVRDHEIVRRVTNNFSI